MIVISGNYLEEQTYTINAGFGKISVQVVPDWRMKMARAKGIRALAMEEGIPLNHRQLMSFREYGLLPDRRDGESDPRDLERLKQILNASVKAQTLDRRLFYLHDAEWPIETRFVRRAVSEVAAKIRNSFTKNRALYRCFEFRSGLLRVDKDEKSKPYTPRLPDKERWPAILRWPMDEEFRTIYEWCRSEIIALAYVPGMRESKDFQVAPFEEMVVLLLLHQLSIPHQEISIAAKETEPWP